MSDPAWWRSAVSYEAYVRSFSDGSGDGTGDLRGLRERLPYLAGLGVDALWITPFFASPMVDHGYDVTDPRDVDPLFGDLADFDAVVTEAHRLGLRVTIDVVPNHVSDRHSWFQAALAAAPGSPERARFVFRDGRGPGGDEPPNNWYSHHPHSAWTRVPDGQWYLHLFTPQQPDLDWRNSTVAEDFDRTLRFWLDRGVDGFRVDMAHGLVKDAELRDNPSPHEYGTEHGDDSRHSVDQPDVHEVYRRWRRLLDSYPGDRMMVGEVNVTDPARRAAYARPDEMHLVFNSTLLRAEWSATGFRSAVEESLATMGAVGAPATWALSSHDAVRHVTRFGDGAVGVRRARAAALLLLALPGPAYLYQGEELGLPQVDVPEDRIRDPLWPRIGVSRDGSRVPVPWEGDAPPYGFCPPDVQPWLPMPAGWGPLTAAAQGADPGSVLSLYRAALRLRRTEPALRGGTLAWADGPEECLVFSRTDGAGPPVTCVVNFAGTPAPRPAGEVLLASSPLAGDDLPADTAAWLRPPSR